MIQSKDVVSRSTDVSTYKQSSSSSPDIWKINFDNGNIDTVNKEYSHAVHVLCIK